MISPGQPRPRGSLLCLPRSRASGIRFGRCCEPIGCWPGPTARIRAGKPFVVFLWFSASVLVGAARGHMKFAPPSERAACSRILVGGDFKTKLVKHSVWNAPLGQRRQRVREHVAPVVGDGSVGT